MNSPVKIFRIFTMLLLLIGTIVVATGIYCYHYKEQIIQKFIGEASKKLQKPIHIHAIQLTAFDVFPKLTLVLQGVVIKQHTKSSHNFMTAQKICCSFDLWNLLKKKYVIDQLCLAHGQINLSSNQTDLFGLDSMEATAKPLEGLVLLKLKKLILAHIKLAYSNPEKGQRYVIKATKMQARLRLDNQHITAAFNGEALVQSIQLPSCHFNKTMPITLQGALTYDPTHKACTLQPTHIQQAKSLVTVQGSWCLGATEAINLAIHGKKVRIQSLVPYLPEPLGPKMHPYQLHGPLTFAVRVTKQPGRRSATRIQGDFALHKGTLLVPHLAHPIELHRVLGQLSIPNMRDVRTATLKVNVFSSTFARSSLEGSLSLYDFHQLYLQYDAKAVLDLASFVMLFPRQMIQNAAGQVAIHGQLQTSIRQLMRHAATQEAMKLSGALNVQAAQFTLGKEKKLLCKDITGHIIFRDNTLVVQDLVGSLGPGNFVLNGTLKNLLAHWLTQEQPLWADAKLYMDYLDLDALLPGQSAPLTQPIGSKQTSSHVKWTIAPSWRFTVDCDIQKLHFRRFQGKQLQGKVQLQEQKLTTEKLALAIAGGKMLWAGTLDASTDRLHSHTTAQLQGVDISRLFYMLDNFHQNFLMHHHLRGNVFADLTLTMELDKQLRMNWDALAADMAIRLENGALKNFTPMQQLAQYIAAEKLADLRFATLKNMITVKDSTVYIPRMEVHSNVTRIQLSGTHTFDGKIAYNFVVPFTSLKQKAQNKLVEEVTVDALAGINLFFKLQGDVKHYTLAYDTEALKKSFQGKLKEQGKLFKALLQGKYPDKEQAKELTLGDYFEFD